MDYKKIVYDSGAIIIETDNGKMFTLEYGEYGPEEKRKMAADGWHFLEEEYWPEDGEPFTALMARYDEKANEWNTEVIKDRTCVNGVWGPSGGIFPHDGYDAYTDLYVAWKR